MDRAVSCSATMMGVRYTARELWKFVKENSSFVEDGVVHAGVPGVDESTAFLTEFCDLLLAVKSDLENAPLPLYFRAPVPGRGVLDVVFTRRAAFLGRVLVPRCTLNEGDIPADMRVPELPLGDVAPGGDRDGELDVEIYNRRVDFINQFDTGEECCADPDGSAVVDDLSCDELDFIIESIRARTVDADPGVLEAVEDLLRDRIHEQFQRVEIVRAISEAILSNETISRLTEALQEGEALSNELGLIRMQLEAQGLLVRPAEEDEAAAEAAAILRDIDRVSRLLGGGGLPHTGPIVQAVWSTLHKWSRDVPSSSPGPPDVSLPQPKVVGPEF